MFHHREQHSSGGFGVGLGVVVVKLHPHSVKYKWVRKKQMLISSVAFMDRYDYRFVVELCNIHRHLPKLAAVNS
jgi:hypothetical protein